MRTKSIALLAVALGCGLVASIGITQVLATRHPEVQIVTGETETIFVALKEVAMGDMLSAESVRLEPWPKDKVPPGAITKLEELDGRRTKVKLFAGEPILEDKLFRKGEEYIPTSLIPKGYRVVAVKATTDTVGGNLLNPGDRVDVMVYLTRNPQLEIETTGMRMVLENIKVFAVNDIVEVGADKESKTIKAATVSLLVTPEQAAKLALAAELGQIKLALRAPDELETGKGLVEARPRDLLGKAEAGRSDKESLVPDEPQSGKTGVSLLEIMKAAAQRSAKAENNKPVLGPMPLPVPQTESWSMRILSPNGVEEVTLQRERNETMGGSKVMDWWRASPSGNGASGGAVRAQWAAPGAAAPAESKGPTAAEKTASPEAEPTAPVSEPVAPPQGDGVASTQ